jgi:hypothetical protein
LQIQPHGLTSVVYGFVTICNEDILAQRKKDFIAQTLGNSEEVVLPNWATLKPLLNHRSTFLSKVKISVPGMNFAEESFHPVFLFCLDGEFNSRGFIPATPEARAQAQAQARARATARRNIITDSPLVISRVLSVPNSSTNQPSSPLTATNYQQLALQRNTTPNRDVSMLMDFHSDSSSGGDESSSEESSENEPENKSNDDSSNSASSENETENTDSNKIQSNNSTISASSSQPVRKSTRVVHQRNKNLAALEDII